MRGKARQARRRGGEEEENDDVVELKKKKKLEISSIHQHINKANHFGPKQREEKGKGRLLEIIIFNA